MVPDKEAEDEDEEYVPPARVGGTEERSEEEEVAPEPVRAPEPVDDGGKKAVVKKRVKKPLPEELDCQYVHNIFLSSSTMLTSRVGRRCPRVPCA